VTPPISIVIPSFNQGPFIERTLASVLGQGVEGLECLVFDGGSTDETRTILERAGSAIRWVSEADRGQAHAVNKGFAGTSAPIVGWLNSDDIYYPGAVQAVLAFFEKHPDVDVLYGEGAHIDAGDVVLEPYPTEDWNFDRLQDRCYLCQPAVFLRRHVFERHGYLDEALRYCMDYEYWLRLALGGARFARIPHRLAATRVYSTTKTAGSRVKVHAEINGMLSRRLGRTPDRWIFNYAHVLMAESPIGRKLAGLPFACAVSALACIAALRWNRRISAAAIRTMIGWNGAALLQLVRRT
jgi:glycosyltransferase involved in cell wall biosynthesis